MRDKIFDFATHPKYVGYQRVLGPTVYRYFDKRSAVCADKSAPTYARPEINYNPEN